MCRSMHRGLQQLNLKLMNTQHVYRNCTPAKHKKDRCQGNQSIMGQAVVSFFFFFFYLE